MSWGIPLNYAGGGGIPVVCHKSFFPFDWKERIKNEENLNKIPLLQLKGWGFNPALREAFNKLHLRGKRTVRADRI